jgi:hypothetical protein
MKKNYIKSLVALLITGAAFTACSSDENIIEQPVNPTEPQVYTMVIKAAKGSDNTNTRALRPGTNGTKNTVDAYWSGNEKIDVVQNDVIIGTATAEPSVNGETTITATFNSAPSESYHMFFYLGGTVWDYTNQVGLLTGTGSISEKYDYSRALLENSNFWPSGNDIIVYDNVTLTFDAPPAAIVKFALVDKADGTTPINATKLNISDEGQDNLIQSFNDLIYNYVYGDITINSSGLTNTIYAALYGVYYTNLKLTAIASDEIFSISKSSAILNSGSYYEINVKMNKILSRVTGDNASDVLAGGYTAKNAEQAAALAKECWTVAGNTVYVVYSASGSLMAPNVSYAYTSDGKTTSTGSATTPQQLLALYGGSNTAWFVEAPAAAEGHALASAAVGEIVGSDGLSYAATDYDNLPTGVTAVAKVCYVDGTGHGLALALADEGKMDWNTAKATCAAHTPAFIGGTWKLASTEEWYNMIIGAGGCKALREGFTSVGGYDLIAEGDEEYYWSSTWNEDEETGGVYAYNFAYDSYDEYSSLNPYAQADEPYLTRACLAF